jgi:hypothetical protein
MLNRSVKVAAHLEVPQNSDSSNSDPANSHLVFDMTWAFRFDTQIDITVIKYNFINCLELNYKNYKI